MGRAPCCDKAIVKKGPWSPEEDAKLKAYIDNHGTGGNWIALPQKIGLKRCGKSCRLRWLNYLRPNIKHGGFTEEEDNIICSLYISIGSRWSIIAAQLPGRTDNDIKNYWNTRLKKKLLGKRKQSQMNRLLLAAHNQDPNNNETNNGVIIEENPLLQNLSNSALERLQLHMQLQGLQNPFSLLNNNPSLWPNNKLNPFNQKMVQNITNEPMASNLDTNEQSTATPPRLESQVEHEDDYVHMSKLECFMNNGNNNNNGILSPSLGQEENHHHGEIQHITGFTQSEIDGLLINESSENHIPEFDCFKQMDGSNINEGFAWWNTELDTNSGSSNSWVSTSSMLIPAQSSEGIMYHHDYASLGYNNM